MTPERRRRLLQILEAALERDPEQRAALLDRECVGDPALREEVESLIASADPPEDFLASNALENVTALHEPEPDSLVGRTAGHYSIEKQLGTGGMGHVYLAHDLRLGRKVALKLLDPELARDLLFRARFIREARLASALDHPNICTIHEIGEVEGRPFIAMQYVEGVTLKQLLARRPLDLQTLLSIALQVANALSAAHERGIIHRDVKPSNIIVTPQGEARVLDFGLAKLLNGSERQADTHLTITGQVMGTPAFMSPEQARGEAMDQRSDVFSFGSLLYQMATGRVPFEGKTVNEIVGALLHKPHTPTMERNKEIPARLSAVIDRALNKEPRQRYQSMHEMISDLRRVQQDVGGPGEGVRSPGVSRARRSQVRPAAIILAIAVILLLGLAFTIYLSRTRQPLPSAPIKSIAVLPFKPLGTDGRDEVLELGMADTLIARLSNIRELEVRPISAVHKYVGLDQDVLAAGREQKVDAVLDGHVQKAGEKIRVTVRLLRTTDGSQLWADRVDADLTDIFAVQDSISERVTGALAVRFGGGERERLTKHHTESAEAYQLYLQGRFHLNRLTDHGFMKGRDYFEQAIDLDPTYALAYAGLADAYNRLSGWNAVAPKDGFPKARAAAEKALSIDPGLADAHIQMGLVKHFHDWDFAGAEEEFKRAIELNQSSSDAHYMYAMYLSTMERFNEALAEMKRAQELEPLSLEKVAGMGDIFHQQRQYDRAIKEYNKALEMDPNSGFAHWALGNVYVSKGAYEEAIAEYQRAIPLSGDSPDELASLGYAYAMSRKRREAQGVLQELQERSKRRYVPPATIAFIYAGLGDRDRAFQWLERAYDEQDLLLVLLKVEPSFDPLRGDPRLANLMRRVGLVPQSK